jgi:hypothetical protein
VLCFTLRVKAEIENNFSISPKLLINTELYGCVLAPRLKKKGYHAIWETNLQPLGANVLAFITNLRPNNKPKMLKVGPPSFVDPSFLV